MTWTPRWRSCGAEEPRSAPARRTTATGSWRWSRCPGRTTCSSTSHGTRRRTPADEGASPPSRDARTPMHPHHGRMSGGVMLIVGLVLALAGIWSVRVALTAAGAGTAWLLADALGSGAVTGLLAAGAGAVLALVVGLLAARVMFFVVGAVVGAVAGARLYAILDTGESSALLAVVFVPAVALVGGVVAERWRERFIGWATAIGGSALVLTGLGLMAPT